MKNKLGTSMQDERIKMSPRLLAKQMLGKNTIICFATTENNQHVAHIIAVQEKHETLGTVAMITQLVVHADFRRRGIASKLVKLACQDADFCGICTSK